MGGCARFRQCRGLSLLEMIITLVILSVLASVVLPVAEVTVRRTKEIELRRALREVRDAIDAYKEDYDQAVQTNTLPGGVTLGESGYPPDLETLVTGKDWGGPKAAKKKYLRRIPKDPFDEYNEGWGLRSYADDADSTVWGGEDVYDVYSQSTAIGLDNTPYNSW
ncbi:MAG: type II secretion system protein [Desulfuromonadaceae bacterium]|jgi:general secretion pathway protein G